MFILSLETPFGSKLELTGKRLYVISAKGKRIEVDVPLAKILALDPGEAIYSDQWIIKRGDCNSSWNTSGREGLSLSLQGRLGLSFHQRRKIQGLGISILREDLINAASEGWLVTSNPPVKTSREG